MVLAHLYYCIDIGGEISRTEEFFLTLINNKWPLGIDPGGHSFVVLNVSINNTPVFVSGVVTFKKGEACTDQ